MPKHNLAPNPQQHTPQLVQKFSDLWWSSQRNAPHLTPSYNKRQQAAQDMHLKQFLLTLSNQLASQPQTPAEYLAVQENVFAALDIFAHCALGFKPQQVDVMLSPGFTQAAALFVQAARRFDPSIDEDAIFQASRNAWVAHGLQMLLGQPVELTPAIFGYSMLYPYSDNYLDDPSIPPDIKKAFNQRFARRLSGEDVPPKNAHEQTIYALVALIESQFERARYPQVYDSLLAIHSAQVRSLRLLRQNASPYEVNVLAASLEKGGASVLADGYLAGGTLTEAQAEFMFGWGAFLQLIDDLQDVVQDRQAGLLTLYSQTAARWPLDKLTNRTFHFGSQVLERLNCFDAPHLEPLKTLMQDSVFLLLIDAAGLASDFYSKAYIRELEKHSPFRFSSLKKLRQHLTSQPLSLVGTFRTFESAHPLPDWMQRLGGQNDRL